MAVEPFVNVNESAYYYNENVPGKLAGARVRQREAKADLRGHMAELLAKAVRLTHAEQSVSSLFEEQVPATV